MKVLSIVGARPQFVKAAMISMELQERGHEEVILHTGQHFDHNMSSVFFDDLRLPQPKYYLGVNRLPHFAMVGKMIEGIGGVLVKECPDWVLIYGDTNTTLAGAIAAKTLRLPLAHIEAGMRCYNFSMPEEINRVVSDRLSDLLFCATPNAVSNLRKEHIVRGVIFSGDVMLDAFRLFAPRARAPVFVDEISGPYLLVTIHREANTSIDRLPNIIKALNHLSTIIKLVFLVHPRTQKAISDYNLKLNFKIYEPVSYLELLYLLKGCLFVITDSGGLQKEAFFASKFCVVVRNSTEWKELVDLNAALLASPSSYNELVTKFLFSLDIARRPQGDFSCDFFGNGDARKTVVDYLETNVKIIAPGGQVAGSRS